MAAQKNNVSRVVLDFGDPKVIAAFIAHVKRQQGDLVSFEDRVLPLIADQLRSQVFGPLLALLQLYPPRRLGMKMRWKSERQRRYVMAMLREMGDLPYTRTGRLGRGWHSVVSIIPKQAIIQARTYNDAMSPRGQTPYMRFVQGDIGTGMSASALARYRQPIQPFHQDRGWQPAAPRLLAAYTKAATVAVDTLQSEADKILQETVA